MAKIINERGLYFVVLVSIEQCKDDGAPAAINAALILSAKNVKQN